MAKSSNTTTQSTNSEPWKAAQPALQTGINDALTLYQGGVGGQTYTGSTVVPYSSQSTNAMNSLESTANANLNGQGLSGQGQGIVASGGYNPAQQSSMDYLGGIGTNPFDLSQNGAYQAYKSNALGDIQDQVNASASRLGRLGSGDNAGRLATELSNASNSMDLAQMQRMDQLNTQRFNAGQTGIGNLSTGYDLQNLPTQDLLQVGGMNEDIYGRQLNDQLRIFDSTQNQPWNQLARLQAVASGAGNYGTSTTTAQTPGQNSLLTGLGYGLTGLGALGSIWG